MDCTAEVTEDKVKYKMKKLLCLERLVAFVTIFRNSVSLVRTIQPDPNY